MARDGPLSMFSNEVQTDIAFIKRFIEKDKIYESLAGLNKVFGPIRVQVLGNEELPSLDEIIAIIRGEEGRRGSWLNLKQQRAQPWSQEMLQ